MSELALPAPEAAHAVALIVGAGGLTISSWLLMSLRDSVPEPVGTVVVTSTL